MDELAIGRLLLASARLLFGGIALCSRVEIGDRKPKEMRYEIKSGLLNGSNQRTTDKRAEQEAISSCMMDGRSSVYQS